MCYYDSATQVHIFSILAQYKYVLFTLGKNAYSFRHTYIMREKTCVATIRAMHFSVCGSCYTLFYYKREKPPTVSVVKSFSFKQCSAIQKSSFVLN